MPSHPPPPHARVLSLSLWSKSAVRVFGLYKWKVTKIIKSSFFLHQLESVIIVISRQITQNLYTILKLNVFWNAPKNWIFRWSCTKARVFTQFTYWICQNTTVAVKFLPETMQMYSMTIIFLPSLIPHVTDPSPLMYYVLSNTYIETLPDSV
jgi:hypothetical protein